MKKTIYNYFFYEFTRYLAVVLFAITSIIWTIQAVNYLDLVTDDGHAFFIYISYSLLTIPKIITKLMPFSFLIATILTILKFEKDNELIILWTSGLNKIHIVNLIFRISILLMLVQLLMSTVINPETLKYSRNLLKNSQLQFIPSLLKEKQFNDTVEGLTIFVDKKNDDGTYENIFIRDDRNVLTQISSGSSTIFAKKAYISTDDKDIILLNGNIQKLQDDGRINTIRFTKTSLDLSELNTKTTSVPKIQETSTLPILRCIQKEFLISRNCITSERIESTGEDFIKNYIKQNKIELNKRFGMPIFIPLIGLVCCFLLSSRKDKKIYHANKYLYFVICFLILIISEISVRYSGISPSHTTFYYLFPLVLLPITYLILIRAFKYENLN